MDDQPKNDGLRELALFAGAGGGILGGKLLGWRTICAVEWEPYAASVLLARQNDGILPPFPIWDDVQTFDGRPWRGRVDVISGGFPCQDISAAGKGAGIDGERSGMWQHMARIVGEVRPNYVFVENSPLLVGRGLTRVLSDLAQMGYDAKWGIVGAHHVAAPHKRDRIWVLGYAIGKQDHKVGRVSECKRDTLGWFEQATQQNNRKPGADGTSGSSEQSEELANTDTKGLQGDQCPRGSDSQGWQKPNGSTAECSGLQQSRKGYWATEPEVGRVAHGVAARVYRLKAIGNGQVPHVAALAWKILSEK